ncbi:MAG: cell division protein FtsX [Nitratireductor sp.]
MTNNEPSSFDAQPTRAAKPARKKQTPPLHSGRNIVPRESISGQALLTVITIMAFLACLTLGAVSMVNDTAKGWQNDISREVTVQIRPFEGVDMDLAIREARLILMSFEEVDNVTLLSDDATKRLLEPWLGTGLVLEELPIPALLTINIKDDTRPNFALIKSRLAEAVPSASLDDHRSWVDRLTNMAYATVITGIIIFSLVMTATILTVVFATRGAMASNREIIEVLHFVGADRKFISKEFEQHFLKLGLKGAIAGGLAAILCFVLLHFWVSLRQATPEADQINALFGSIALSWMGYAGIVLVIFAVSFLTAFTSRVTVKKHVGMLETYGSRKTF